MSALREVFAVFGIEVDDRELKKADKSVKGFGDQLKGLGKTLRNTTAVLGGFFAVKGLANFVDKFRAAGDLIDKTSFQMGMTTLEFQKMEFAAALSSVSVTNMSTGLRQLAKNAFEAQRGSKPVQEVFDKIGVSIFGIDGTLKGTQELLTDVAGGIHGLANDTEKLAAAQTLLGRSGALLLPLFSEGAKGIREAGAEFTRLGGGISQETVKAAVELSDEMARMDTAFKGVKSTILRFILPALTRVTKFITDSSAAFTRFAKRTRAAEILLITLTGAFTTLSLALLKSFAPGIAKAVLAFGPLALKVAIISAGIAAFALLIEDLIVLFQGGDSVIGEFIDTLFGIGAAKEFVNDVKTSFSVLSAFVEHHVIPPLRKVWETIKNVADSLGVFDGLRDALGLPKVEEAAPPEERNRSLQKNAARERRIVVTKGESLEDAVARTNRDMTRMGILFRYDLGEDGEIKGREIDRSETETQTTPQRREPTGAPRDTSSRELRTPRDTSRNLTPPAAIAAPPLVFNPLTTAPPVAPSSVLNSRNSNTVTQKNELVVNVNGSNMDTKAVADKVIAAVAEQEKTNNKMLLAQLVPQG